MTIPERVMLSQLSASVSFAMRSRVYERASSVSVPASGSAIGAVLLHEILTVTVEVFERAP